MTSSESGSSPGPAPVRKRMCEEVELSDNCSSHDASDASSDELEEHSDVPPPLPTVESTVLSHAERRRQKKRKKQSQLVSETERTSKKPKLDESADGSRPAKTRTQAKAKASSAATDDPRRQKRQHSVWVGNLSFRTTQDGLRGFFDGVGTITRVHMPIRRGKQGQSENMGFAYVDFETSDAKVIAITLSEGVLDSRNLLIKDGDDFAGRPAKAQPVDKYADGEERRKDDTKPDESTTTPDGKGLCKTAQKILRLQKQPPAPTLFLGNLGFETTEESIRELFEAHRYWRLKSKGTGTIKRFDHKTEVAEGEDGPEKSKDVWIRKIRMGTFEDSGACKGFAFIDFTSIEHATDALVNPRNHRLNGRDLVVEYASPDAVRRGGGSRYSKGDRDQERKSGARTPRNHATGNAPYSKRQPRKSYTDQDDELDSEVAAGATTTPRSRRSDRIGYDRPATRRARPGAALAEAQRQSAAILPSMGQKIVF